MAPVSTAENLVYSEPQATRAGLVFKPVTAADSASINRIVSLSRSFTCDYTVGGIVMWADYFKYSYCIYLDTLFIMGVEENHPELTAFSCPVGSLPLPEAIEVLDTYCRQEQLPLRFSAIPADKLACFTTLNPECQIEELADWADYVYEAETFATLAGKKMAKKRNHVNHFATEHPQFCVEPLNRQNALEALEAMRQWEHALSNTPAADSRREEFEQVEHVLRNLALYPFEGLVLRTRPGAPVVAFSAAEIIGPMAFVHIEKMDHICGGAGETIAHLLMKRLTATHPEVRYVNREEDCGDPGLRRAKESWHPAMLLKKYNITF